MTQYNEYNDPIYGLQTIVYNKYVQVHDYVCTCTGIQTPECCNLSMNSLVVGVKLHYWTYCDMNDF